MEKTDRHKKQESGFTLIELVMVLVIAGITIAFFSTSLFNLKKETAHTITQERIDAVADVIRRYALYNERLPCPGGPHLAQEHQDFGWFDNTLSACGSANGIVSNANVSVGMVPVRSLGLPSSFAYDAWGSRLMLAVSPNMVSRTTYRGATPSLTVDDTPVPFVVYSVGPDRKGGYPSQLTTGAPIGCLSEPGLDQENCDNDREFTYRAQSSAPGANYYDDLIAFRFLPRISGGEFMPNAVVAFRLTACPTGWTRFTQANGRSIVGATRADIPSQASGTSGPIDTTTTTRTFTTGQAYGALTRTDHGGGSTYSAMPPYFYTNVIYCRKD